MARSGVALCVLLASAVAALLAGGLACSSSPGAGVPDAGPADAGPYEDPVAIQARLEATLADLAGIGDKGAGTPGGVAAGEYVAARLRAAGLQDVAFEPFAFPAFTVDASTLAVTADGAALPMAHEVFAYSGVGHVSAEVVYVGAGRAPAYEGLDVAGKVVLVTRDTTFHRSTQLTRVFEHGGAAMLYVSASPDNLIQIGTVADAEDGLGPLPAVTVGHDDGGRIIDALAAGQTVVATIDVAASVHPATGRNVVGRIPGTDPSGAYLVVGAHYDTWYVGSTDNGSGVAALVELAEALARRPARRLGLLFVAFDAEELGLFGGYQLLRDHVTVGGEPMVGFVNLEIPSAGPDDIRALGFTHGGPLEEALAREDLRALYYLYVGMEVVAEMFGGLVPTDIQGLYWHGLQGFSTACDSTYYHTTEDTPDKVDTAFLARAAVRLAAVIDGVDAEAPAAFAVQDPTVWRVAATATPAAGGDLAVTAVVTDAAGAPRVGGRVWLSVYVDDFTRVARLEGTADADGGASFTVPAAALAASTGAGGTWLHVVAGDEVPVGERILAVP